MQIVEVNTDETFEDLKTSQEDVDYAYLDGEVSDQEHEDMTQINYLMGGK